MDSKELLAYCRTRLDDTVGGLTHALFSNKELYEYLSDCQEQMALECLVVRAAPGMPNDLCTISAVSGTDTVQHSPSLLRVDEVRYTTATLSKRIKKQDSGKMPLHLVSGVPAYFNLDLSPGSLSLDKIPDEDFVITLWGRRMPLNPIDANIPPEIPVNYHRRLVNGVLGRAFMKPDIETYNPTKAAGYMALFKEDLEWVRRADLRLYSSGARG